MCYNVEEWDGLPILRKKRKKRKDGGVGILCDRLCQKALFCRKNPTDQPKPFRNPPQIRDPLCLMLEGNEG